MCVDSSGHIILNEGWCRIKIVYWLTTMTTKFGVLTSSAPEILGREGLQLKMNILISGDEISGNYSQKVRA